MPRATLRTRCGREVAIAYTLHSIETISEAALQGRVSASPSAAAVEAARHAAAGSASHAEAQAMAAVLDSRPRGHGVFSTRSFDGEEAAGDGDRGKASSALPSRRGLANGPSRDVVVGAAGSDHDAALGVAMTPRDSRSGSDARKQAAADVTPTRHDSAATVGSGRKDSSDAGGGHPRPRVARDPQRLLVLGGMGARGDNGWFNHVVEHMAALRQPNTGEGAAVVCTMDYRGIGGSTIFKHFWEYSTGAMAADALALLEHLGWERTHLIGMSLGAMVACQMMSAAPERIASATLLGTTLTGWEMLIPLHLRPVRLAKLMFGTRGMQLRATLPFYFSKDFLQRPAGFAEMASPDLEDLKGVKLPNAHFCHGSFYRPTRPLQKTKEQDSDAGAALLGDMSREEVIMRASALAVARGQSNRFADWDQPAPGRRGHLWATGHHWLHSKEARKIAESGVPVHVIHGSQDPLATVFFARRVQRRLQCKFTLTEASHAGITVESCTVVLPALEEAMFGRSISDADTWRRRQEQATASVICNPFFLSL